MLTRHLCLCKPKSSRTFILTVSYHNPKLDFVLQDDLISRDKGSIFEVVSKMNFLQTPAQRHVRGLFKLVSIFRQAFSDRKLSERISSSGGVIKSSGVFPIKISSSVSVCFMPTFFQSCNVPHSGLYTGHAIHIVGAADRNLVTRYKNVW